MAKKRQLRIASYNINGINSRLRILTRWLEAFQPDVVGLQELKCTDEAFPHEAIEALGYSAIWHGQKSWNGVALLSRVGAPALLMGDFNIIPTDEDVYKPERWFKDALFAPEARERYRELVAQGWTDAIRRLFPDERIYTFWHYWRNSFERDAGIRIDHALLSPSLAKKLKAAGVDRTQRGWEKTSDHAPVWVEVEV